MPAFTEPSPNVATTAASIEANEPIISIEANIIRTTDGFCSTRPSLRVAAGITSRRTRGASANSSPPATWIATTTSSAVEVPKPATRRVIRTGPNTQISSCRAASRLNRAVSIRCGAMTGYRVRTAGMTGGIAAPPIAASAAWPARGRCSAASSPKEAEEITRVTRRTGMVPNRLSWRETIGPAMAMPIEKAARTMPAEV